MLENPKYWTGQVDTQCQAGPHQITTRFYDCRTTMGPWAIVCPACFRRVGVGLGTGRGQRYDRQADGRWLKTAG